MNGGGIGVLGQRYNASGVAQGGQFVVNSTITGDQAWVHETDAGGQRYVAVLNLPPVKGASDAVRASIVAASDNPKR